MVLTVKLSKCSLRLPMLVNKGSKVRVVAGNWWELKFLNFVMIMPKLYIKKSNKNQWTSAQLDAAMKAVQSGQMSVRAAGLRFSIPKSTLQDHLKGTSTKRYGGPQTILTTSEEKEIVTSCIVMQEMGFPLTRDFVSVCVRDFLRGSERSHHFKGGIPSYDWWLGFLRRNPNLVERKPEHLQHQRAQAAKPEVIK